MSKSIEICRVGLTVATFEECNCPSCKRCVKSWEELYNSARNRDSLKATLSDVASGAIVAAGLIVVTYAAVAWFVS